MSLGERIREQRKSRRMSQEKVAELVGVSRQAVAKWESGQSVPTTENLLRLAEAFGITVDSLLRSEESGEQHAAGEVCRFEPSAKEGREERRRRRNRNCLAAAGVAAGYLIVYLLGRILGGNLEGSSVLGWLFGREPGRLSYLYGWLLQQNLFWAAMVVSVLPAFWGKYRFSCAALFGFSSGLALGEQLGEYPAGAAWGHGHYGWAIWGGIFLFSIVMGIALERQRKKGCSLRSKEFGVWAAVFLVGIAAVTALVRCSFPETFGG